MNAVVYARQNELCQLSLQAPLVNDWLHSRHTTPHSAFDRPAFHAASGQPALPQQQLQSGVEAVWDAVNVGSQSADEHGCRPRVALELDQGLPQDGEESEKGPGFLSRSFSMAGRNRSLAAAKDHSPDRAGPGSPMAKLMRHSYAVKEEPPEASVSGKVSARAGAWTSFE